MIVEHLCDHREAIPRLVQWYVSEWEPYYGDAGPADAQADLETRCSREVLPIGFVALEQGDVVATAAIGLDVTTGLIPSVIGLLVEPDCRGQGIGSDLIDACSTAARTLGYGKLHISTSVLVSRLEKTGWQKIGKTTFLNNEQGSVYVLDL